MVHLCEDGSIPEYPRMTLRWGIANPEQFIVVEQVLAEMEMDMPEIEVASVESEIEMEMEMEMPEPEMKVEAEPTTEPEPEMEEPVNEPEPETKDEFRSSALSELLPHGGVTLLFLRQTILG